MVSMSLHLGSEALPEVLWRGSVLYKQTFLLFLSVVGSRHTRNIKWWWWWWYFYLSSVCPDLSAIRRDDAERRAGHIDGDVVDSEVGTKPEVKPDVATSGAGVAVDRNETLSVGRRQRRAAAVRLALWRQIQRQLELKSSVLGETGLHPADIALAILTPILTLIHVLCL